jgi:hypothetical protein
MDVPLPWDSDSYSDDIPYWVDFPAEKNEENPKGMLMIPYSYGTSSSLEKLAPNLALYRLK